MVSFDIAAAAGLWSLPHYGNLRRDSPLVIRNEKSNVDLVAQEDGEVVPICHLDVMLGFTSTSGGAATTGALASLAAHHLNTGDGKFVPALEGLPERCPIRFTVEATNSEYDRGVALDKMKEHLRDRTQAKIEYNTSLPAPCAILGDVYSSITTLTAPVSGVFEVPHVSASATSAALDNKDIYKLFGRTIPSDNGIAITIIQFLSNVLGLKHFNVITQNDAFQNALVDSLQETIDRIAPDMIMHTVVYSPDSPKGAQEVVMRLQESRYRYTFCFTWSSHSGDIIQEALASGMAGDGLHQWFFVGDTFRESFLRDNQFEIDSPLYDFYQGVGVIDIFGGEPEMPFFDQLQEELTALPKDPANQEYLADFYSTVFSPQDIQKDMLADNATWLQERSVYTYTPFWYEAVVALGLAACDAWDPYNKTLRGVDHYAAFRDVSFAGLTGNVVFNNVTGSRDPTSASYRLLNYRREQYNETFYAFHPTMAYTYTEGAWTLHDQYVFNDGTTNVPIDISPLPPEPEDTFWDNTPAVIGVIVALFAVLVVIYAIVREWRRKADDMLWKIQREDLKFEDPPVVLGQGTFGEVLLAEYRGTKVAVKQIHKSLTESDISSTLKPGCYLASTDGRGNKVSGSFFQSRRSGNSGTQAIDEESGTRSSFGRSSMNSRGNLRNTATMMFARKNNFQKQIMEDFMQEMRQLSRLRHPCVATVMGAVLDTKSPMLVMEHMLMGSLYDVIHNPTIHLDGDMIIGIVSDITQGLRFLHASVPQVIHGDLKAQNVLVDAHFRAKVADFGLSQKTTQLGGTGTPYWMAPELLRGESANTRASDVFSFGVLMFEVVAREEPYEGENGNEVIAAIMDKNIKKRVALPKYLNDKVRSVIMDCMDENPDARATFDEIDTRLRRLDAKSFESTLAKPERSLKDVMPEHVAKAVEAGKRVENVRRDNVTIFACMITGLDAILGKMSPFKVACMVDRLETNLRNLSKKHGVLLFQTDGNVFMAAANAVDDQPDHAQRMANFALEVCKNNHTRLDESDSSLSAYVCVKGGLHVGSVVTGVTGSRQPRFSLFGEEVYVSTLLAKHSELGMVNCSSEAANAIKEGGDESLQVKVRADSSLTLRFKGKVQTHWVAGAAAGATDAFLAKFRLRQYNQLMDQKVEEEADE